MKRCGKVLKGVERCRKVLKCVEKCWKVLKCVEMCYKLLKGVDKCQNVLKGVERGGAPLMRSPDDLSIMMSYVHGKTIFGMLNKTTFNKNAIQIGLFCYCLNL